MYRNLGLALGALTVIFVTPAWAENPLPLAAHLIPRGVTSALPESDPGRGYSSGSATMASQSIQLGAPSTVPNEDHDERGIPTAEDAQSETLPETGTNDVIGGRLKPRSQASAVIYNRGLRQDFELNRRDQLLPSNMRIDADKAVDPDARMPFDN